MPSATIPAAWPSGRFTQTDNFRLIEVEPGIPFSVGPRSAGVFRQTQAAKVAALFPPSAHLFYGASDKASAQKSAAFFLDKYLYPPTLPQGSRYLASSSDGLIGRATDAASRIFWTRDGSGARRLNTSYFLRVATSIAADTASRPFWKRSASGPFSDFGSTIGNDAGMNLFHEFGPDLGQVVTSHLPKFVSRIEERILQQIPHGQSPQNQNPRAGGTLPTR